MVRDTRVILVEGMPGTGKSTTAQAINAQLSTSGLPSYWWHEEKFAHPVRLFYERQKHHSWSDYTEEAVSLWRDFARGLRDQNLIAVLDASILQNHVRSMLLFGCNLDPILDLVQRIETQLTSLSPVWIYLKPKDIEKNFREVTDVRGKPLLDLWIAAHERFPYALKTGDRGYRGFINFWREFDAIGDRLLNEVTFSKIGLSVSCDDWKYRYDQIFSFLGLPKPSESSSSVDLEHFTGAYASDPDFVSSDSVSAVFTLEVKNGSLIIQCNDPTMEADRGPIGCYRNVRLIPKGENCFQIEAWPHEIEFNEDDAGRVITMCLSVADNNWPQSRGKFRRTS